MPWLQDWSGATSAVDDATSLQYTRCCAPTLQVLACAWPCSWHLIAQVNIQNGKRRFFFVDMYQGPHCRVLPVWGLLHTEPDHESFGQSPDRPKRLGILRAPGRSSSIASRLPLHLPVILQCSVVMARISANI
jgi:hypothetical protein